MKDYDYLVATGENESNLWRQVMGAKDLGYWPIGGIAVSIAAGDHRQFYQAMIRDKKEKKSD